MVMAGHFVEVGRIDLKVNTDKRKVVLSGGERMECEIHVDGAI